MTHNMKHLTLAVAAMACSLLIGCGDQYTIKLTMNEDGTSQLVTVTSAPRATMEQMVKAQSGMGMFDDDEPWDEGSAPPDTPDDEAASSGTTDADLAAHVRKQAERQAAFAGDSDSVSVDVEKIDVGEQYVTLTTRAVFNDLESLAHYMPRLLNMTGDLSVQLEKAEQGHFALVIKKNEVSEAEFNQQVPMVKGMLQSTKTKMQITMVMPGKIASSNFGETSDRTVNFTADAAQTQGVDAIVELLRLAEYRIVADAGGLALDALPLDSKDFGEPSFDPGMFDDDAPVAPDVEITEGGEGFMAEGAKVETTTIHYYPRGADLLNDTHRMMFGHEAATSVGATLYPPANRFIAAIESVKVLSAKDDQGRAIEFGERSGLYNRSFGESGPNMDFQLQLGRVPADAEAIERIEVELIAQTHAGHAEQDIGAIKPAPDTAVDLASLIPGAKLFIRRTRTDKDGQSNEHFSQVGGAVELRIIGPPAIATLVFDVTLAGQGDGNVNVMQNTFKDDGETSRRDLRLQYNAFVQGRGPLQCTLVAKKPQDVKRQRVKVMLEGLDLP